MDNGAHFNRCDLQVHTPRDRQWMGDACITETDRKALAAKYIEACREHELHAIAITDHHDLAFFPYIRNAAQTEKDSGENLLPPEKRIVVFPGIELTLAIPCQALLLFDPNLPDAALNVVLPHLGITVVPSTEQYGPDIQQLAQFTSFQDLYTRLDENAELRGRYIVLPHVQDGGHQTLLRSGFASHYQDMPCVGGYLDGSIDRLGIGNTNILEGRDENYGNKPLGVFQTSDCRQEDFATLGQHSTWVKWSTPSAEALRQACLARQSRIFQTEPRYPAAKILSVEVSNSAFLGPTKLELNPQYNAFIGGRGTGKSSLLEYIRWALCDQAVEINEEAMTDVPNYAAKRNLLIKKTLTEISAIVTVCYEVNGVLHYIKRNSKSGELLLRVGDAEWTSVSEEEVQKRLPIQAYSQKQLSSVAVLPHEIQRLVTAEITAETDTINDELKLLSDTVRELSAQDQRKDNLQKEIDTDKKQTVSLKAQVETLRKSLKGLSEEDQKVLAKEPKYSMEETFADQIEREVKATQEALGTLKGQIDLRLSQDLLPEEPPDQEAAQEVWTEYKTALDTISKTLADSEGHLVGVDAVSNKFQSALKKIRESITRYKALYEAAKGKSTSHQSALEELGRLEKYLQGLTKSIADKSAVAGTLGDPKSSLKTKWIKWNQLHVKRSELIKTQCEKLLDLSGGAFRATVRGFGDPEPIRGALSQAFTKKNIRKVDEKTASLVEIITRAGNPLKKWIDLIREMQSLLLQKESAVLPDTPILEGAGLTHQNRESLRDGITRDVLLDLRLTVLEDLPEFEFKAGADKYIAFAEASSGQQATALLRILLNQEGPPLLIDQPEEDLDNEVIQEIAEIIWSTKSKRQLIFVSHNANLVVNGDAELILWFDYVVPGDPSHGHIRAEGAIDLPKIRECIKKIMEGGKKAFELRRQKYGF